MTRVAIIGAGMAGIACARGLAKAGVAVTLFDKGRGIGGRVATRRAGDLRFDHGVPYATAQSGAGAAGDSFSARLRDLIRAGDAAPWIDGAGRDRIVGIPGMSALPKGLAAGLDVRLATQISDVQPKGAGWRLMCGKMQETASHLVVTVPAPQVAGLLGEAHPLLDQIAGVEMSPGLTLMAATRGAAAQINQDTSDGPLVLITNDSSKPHRPQGDVTAWVAHAALDFTLAQLEADLTDIAALMVPLLFARLGVPTETVTHAVAHRWRYARVSKPLGQPFVRNADATLYLGGDWCLGPQMEHAWTSGSAIAANLLERGL